MRENRSKTNLKKADKLEAAGDKLATKGDFKKALKKYRDAAKEDPGRAALYDKLVGSLEKAKPEWKEEDFVESLSWTMKKQELEEPGIRQVHAKLTPEWKRVTELAISALNAPDEKIFVKYSEELVASGEIATRVLLELLRMIKYPPQEGQGEA
jgi:hypothetical protein